jgi:hypothetical protein
MTGKKVSEKFQKALAFPQLSLYNIKAFRTGADSPHVVQLTEELGREADASRRNKQISLLEEIKCLSYP